MKSRRQSLQLLALANRFKRGALAWTQQRKLLLVLDDNFEHLLPAAGFVADLLAAASEMKILRPTREALRISGEQRYAVGRSRHFVQTTRILIPRTGSSRLEEAVPLVMQTCAHWSGLDRPAGAPDRSDATGYAPQLV
jgi:predicted ATPase